MAEYRIPPASEPLSIERLIRYDPCELEAETRRLLHEVGQLVILPPASDLLGPEITGQFGEAARHMAERLVTPFRIVVMGDLKRGKSTLINAMLGEPLLETDVVAGTVVITEICYGETARARLCLADGGHIDLGPGEVNNARLEPLLESLGERVSRLAIQAPINLLKDITWVDTPGGGELFRRFDDRIANYISEADLVVIVVSPLSPLSSSEVEFHTRTLARHDFPKVYVVLNMIDLVRAPADRLRVEALLRKRLGQILPGAQVFALSAADEMARLGFAAGAATRTNDALRGAFANFRASIEDLVQVRGEAIQLQRILDLAEQSFDGLTRRLQLIKIGLNAEAQQLAQVVSVNLARAADLAAETRRDREQLKAQVEEFIAQAKIWLRAFAARLIDEVGRQAKGLPAETLDRHLSFFLADMLRQALYLCLEAHRPKAELMAREWLARIARQLQPLASASEIATPTDEVTFNELLWDQIQMVDHTADRFLFGSGSIVDALGSLIGQPGEAESNSNIGNLRDRQVALDTELERLVERVYPNLCDLLERELDRAHTTQAQAISEALRQAQVLVSQHDKVQSSRVNDLDGIGTRLHDARERFAQLRLKLANG